MKLKLAVLAAATILGPAGILGLASAQASTYTVTDLGTGLASLGIVPVPGQGYSPFWGGNTNFYGLKGSNDLFPGGVPHADLEDSDQRYDLTPWPYQYSGLTTTTITTGALAAVGFVGGNCNGGCTSGPSQAALWTDSVINGAPIFINLHPAGYVASLAQGANGNVQVGWGTDSANVLHPLVWQGTAASVRQLPLPGALVQGAAAAASPTYFFDIVGYGFGPDGLYHPVAWNPSGTGYLPVDILPAGDLQGVAVASALGAVGGSVITPSSNGHWHAAYWGDTTTNHFMDMHPPAHGKTTYLASSIYAMSATANNKALYMVGLAVVADQSQSWHAMIWRGAELAPTDLHAQLGSGFVQSVATGVDWYGNVSGAAQDTSGVWHQVYWGH